MARRSWWNDEYFPPSRPRKAKGGIKAQSKRGGFGESWWAKRWIEVLESFDLGARLARGRSYARSGQVLSIAIEKGKVKAKVQGSRPKPYAVTIEVKPLAEPTGTKVLDGAGRQALFAAKLLAGEMPQDIETVFQEVGLSLFPAQLGDLKTDCSCPDWSNPCKHIAAVYYLLGEEFDRDPFLIFTLRGLGRDALMARLGATSPGRVGAGGSPAIAPSARAPERRGRDLLGRGRGAHRGSLRRGRDPGHAGGAGPSSGRIPLLARRVAIPGDVERDVRRGLAARPGCAPRAGRAGSIDPRPSRPLGPVGSVLADCPACRPGLDSSRIEPGLARDRSPEDLPCRTRRPRSAT